MREHDETCFLYRARPKGTGRVIHQLPVLISRIKKWRNSLSGSCIIRRRMACGDHHCGISEYVVPIARRRPAVPE
jgi:hypothetical protein